jgi:hypothetical protein
VADFGPAQAGHWAGKQALAKNRRDEHSSTVAPGIPIQQAPPDEVKTSQRDRSQRVAATGSASRLFAEGEKTSREASRPGLA